LHDVLFVGNPIYEGMDRREAKLRVLKRVPQVLKIDGDVIVEADREAAAKLD
jgi:dynein light chain 1